ncbi:MAG: transcriptional repressor LexA [Thermoleophilia bacterium]|jgi:repressor LexA|nr:transcriptional repressor LexA [Thermoleophilia bacterium]
MDELSGRQAEILDFISGYCQRHGYPPTVREIGSGVGLASPSTVHAHLAKLERAGHIRRDPTKPRAMLVHLPQAPPAPAGDVPPAEALPLVGSVAAGLPALAEQDVEDWVVAPFRADFLLRVRGDSMTGAGILDGDLVAVRRQDTAHDGEVVVALIEDEATVKRIYREPAGVRLQAENPAYAPIVSPDVQVLGRVVGVMRTL